MSLNLPAVNLGTLAMESFCYGIFLMLSIASIALFFHNSTQRSARRVDPSVFKNPMFIGSVWMLLTITAHWVCTVVRGFQAFVTFQDGRAPLLYYADLSQPSQVAKTASLCLSLIAGDGMMIYRLWLSWGYNTYVVIFPSLCLTAAIACSIGVTYEFSRFELGMDVFASSLGRWIRSNAILTVATNLFCTCMIAWPIYKANKKASTAASSNLLSMLAIVSESALMYTIWTIFFLITYETKSNLQFNTVDLWALSAGLAFMLINVRAGLGWSRNVSFMHGSASKGGSSSHALSAPPQFMETLDYGSSSPEMFDMKSVQEAEEAAANGRRPRFGLPDGTSDPYHSSSYV